MKFMFVGNPGRRDDSNTVTVFGKTFPMRVPVEVTDEFAIGKLKNNRHFVVVEDGAPAAPAVVADEVDAAPAPDATDTAVYAESAPRKARKAK